MAINEAIATITAESLKNGWIHIEHILCEECLKQTEKHLDQMLGRLFSATGMPKKNYPYKQIVPIINEAYENDQVKGKEIRHQVRKLINEHLSEAAQHVCLNKKDHISLESIADELSLLLNLFSLNRETGVASFDQLERFVDFCGRIELAEYGRQAKQSSHRNSATMLRGRNLYDRNEGKSTFEIRLQIKNFFSRIYIGICSDNVPPNEIEQASNAFPIDPLGNVREGNIVHLLIDVTNYTIYLWNEYQSKKYQNSEPHKRERKISRRKCPLPWRYFVILTSKNNHVRIVY
jgi:hypothetical protein